MSSYYLSEENNIIIFVLQESLDTGIRQGVEKLGSVFC